MKKIIIGMIMIVLLSISAISFDIIEEEVVVEESNIMTHSAPMFEGGDFPDEEEFDFNGQVVVEAPGGYEISYNPYGTGLIKVLIEQDDTRAVRGKNNGGTGIYARSYGNDKYAVRGYSSQGWGVYGKSGSSSYCGIYARSDQGVYSGLGCGDYSIDAGDSISIGGDIDMAGGRIDTDESELDIISDVRFYGEVNVYEKLRLYGICCDTDCGSCNVYDVAETFHTEEEPGTVVSLAGEFKETVISTRAYDKKVVGVVSENPTITMGKSEHMQPIALSGVVNTKASAENGHIEVGDLLVTSNTPGHVMKCDDKRKCIGALVGKAMEPLDKGTGEILVLVMMTG